jgi:hypothetical protein
VFDPLNEALQETLCPKDVQQEIPSCNKKKKQDKKKLYTCTRNFVISNILAMLKNLTIEPTRHLGNHISWHSDPSENPSLLHNW